MSSRKAIQCRGADIVLMENPLQPFVLLVIYCMGCSGTRCTLPSLGLCVVLTSCSAECCAAGLLPLKDLLGPSYLSEGSQGVPEQLTPPPWSCTCVLGTPQLLRGSSDLNQTSLKALVLPECSACSGCGVQSTEAIPSLILLEISHLSSPWSCLPHACAVLEPGDVSLSWRAVSFKQYIS